MTAFRIDTASRIDRTRPLHFTFDGVRIAGIEGDTIA